MSSDWNSKIAALESSNLPRLAGEIAAVAEELNEAIEESLLSQEARERLVSILVDLIESGKGEIHARLVCGEILGRLGDTRLSFPEDDAYWVHLELESGDAFQIGQFAVTNQEYSRWVASGGYGNKEVWSVEGLAWLEAVDNPWPELAKRPDAANVLLPNQPVVGITRFEAMAYATAHGARLPRWYERVWAVRGRENRPYPWGSPFGDGNANTAEEVLKRPTAVGLYSHDVTPEGVRDLAGNVGEWTADSNGEEYLLHPGSWDQPSLASWAKALTTEPPESRWAALGFRLVKD